MSELAVEPEIGLSTGEAARIIGTSHDNISYYVRNELVLPSVDAGRGRGHLRRYGFNDLVALTVVVEASQALGVSLKTLKPILKMIQEHPDLSQIDHPAYAFIDGSCHGIVYDLHKAHGSGCSLVIDLRIIARRLLKRVTQ